MANVSIGIGYIDKKERNRAQQTCHVDFCSRRKTTWKKTHRKRHFSFDTAVMALLARGGVKQKQEEKVVQPTLFTDGGSVKELLFESSQVEDGFPGMQHCKKILHSPYICHDSLLPLIPVPREDEYSAFQSSNFCFLYCTGGFGDAPSTLPNGERSPQTEGTLARVQASAARTWSQQRPLVAAAEGWEKLFSGICLFVTHSVGRITSSAKTFLAFEPK